MLFRSQQQYDQAQFALKQKIDDLEFSNRQLNIASIDKESQINSLEYKLKELENKDEDVIENNTTLSSIKFLQQLFTEIPYCTKKAEFIDLKENINGFLDRKITSEIGYSTKFSYTELQNSLTLYISYNVYDYDKKDIIIFRELMMKTINNEDLICEMGWVINESAGVDLFISRSEVGIRITLKSEYESYYHRNDTSDYIDALFISHDLID